MQLKNSSFIGSRWSFILCVFFLYFFYLKYSIHLFAVPSSTFLSGFHQDTLQRAYSAFSHLPKGFSSRYSAACLQCPLPPSQVVFIQILCSLPAVPSFTFPSGFNPDTLQRACAGIFKLSTRDKTEYRNRVIVPARQAT
jgi:hypothetical protein